MQGGRHVGATEECPRPTMGAMGPRGGHDAAGGQSRRPWVAPLGSRGAREGAQPKGAPGKGTQQGQAGGIQAKAPQDFSVRITSPSDVSVGATTLLLLVLSTGPQLGMCFAIKDQQSSPVLLGHLQGTSGAGTG